MSEEQERSERYDLAQRVRELRRAVFEYGDETKVEALIAEERKIAEQSDAIVTPAGIRSSAGGNLLGADTTNLEVTMRLRMPLVPTSIVHVIDSNDMPLMEVKLKNFSPDKTKRLRVSCTVQGYSAEAIETIEVGPGRTDTVLLSPTYFPSKLKEVTELTRASVTVLVEDLDAKAEMHRTLRVSLLALSSMPLAIPDPATGQRRDMKPYLAAFVTPNAPEVMSFVRKAADKHPNKMLVGYQGDAGVVIAQAKAIFDALKDSGIVYVNSVIDFTPEVTWLHQRVRRPSESLNDRQANCIDGTVLMASLLEAVSITPAIVIVPGHAFLAFGTDSELTNRQYIETTMIGTSTYEQANATGNTRGQTYLNSGTMSVLWLRDLRAKGITPLE